MPNLPWIIASVYERCGTVEELAQAQASRGVVLRAINIAWNDMITRASRIAPSLARRVKTITLENNSFYPLPFDCAYVEELKGPDGAVVNPFPERRGGASETRARFEVIGGKIRIVNGREGSHTLVYQRRWPELHMGAVGGDAATEEPSDWPEDAGEFAAGKYMALATPSGTTHLNFGPTWEGRIERGNWLEGLTLTLHGGTGAGQSRMIAGQAGGYSAPYVALHEAWEVAPVKTTSMYSIMPPWPSKHNDLLTWRAIGRLPVQEWAAMAASHPEGGLAQEEFDQWASQLRKQGRDFASDFSGAMMVNSL